MKIQVIGASGTGKSTLCKYISDKTGVYWIETDRYLWKDDAFTENYPIEERLRMYSDDIGTHRDYIVSGSVHFWNPEGFKDRELLVLLKLDEETRMKRLCDREFFRYGESMLPGGDHYRATREFLEWCETYISGDEYASTSLACHMRLLREAACRTLILDANLPVDVLCKQVLDTDIMY
jgi:adenylate kinase family enzyme